jgi:hypothetical protein
VRNVKRNRISGIGERSAMVPECKSGKILLMRITQDHIVKACIERINRYVENRLV